MDDDAELADRFEAHRTRLRAVAHHVLGSPSEADDAVQEAWLRLRRSDSGSIENLGGWLTTVVARVCLDMLRSRREEPVGIHLPESAVNDSGGLDPEREALRSNGAEAVRGAAAVAGRTSDFARFAQVTLLALVDGGVGMVNAAHGRPVTLTVFTVDGEKIAAIDIIDNPRRVTEADLAILGRLREPARRGTPAVPHRGTDPRS
jgi:Sigma-70 region 2